MRTWISANEFLRNLISGRFRGLAPADPFWVVGDIHGRFDLLQHVLQKHEAEGVSLPLVFVGDYIDRGPDSLGVIRKLASYQHQNDRQIICLLGNHEQMLLEALAQPDTSMMRWLRAGGDATLHSCAIRIDEAKERSSLKGLAQKLGNSLGSELISWLTERPPIWISGNAAVTHAGANPHLPLTAQPPTNFIWGHSDCGTVARKDGMWLLHGHSIVKFPTISRRTVAIDTGAYRGNPLTVAKVDRERIVFDAIY